MRRMTAKLKISNYSGTRYKTSRHKDDLVQRLGKYEDTGLAPAEIQQLKAQKEARAGVFALPRIWHDATENPPTDERSVLAVVSGTYNGTIYDNAYMVGKYNQKSGWRLDLAPGWKTPVVIEWQPLPRRTIDLECAAK